MTEYRSIRVPLDHPVSNEVLGLATDLFKAQPEPRPFIAVGASGCLFHFHTLDVELLKKSLATLTSENLFSENRSAEDDQAVRLVDAILNEVQQIGSYGIKSGKRQYVGFNDERKVINRREKVAARTQHYYANAANFSQAENELPPSLTNRIICGDSLQVLKALPDNSIDLVFTSPPYNFGLEYDSQADAHQWEDYFEKLYAIFDECIRVTKHGGRIAVNIQPLFSDYIPSHHLVSNHFISRRMIWKGEILWEKNNYNCKYTAWGSWKSPSNPYLKYTWEFIEVFCKGTLKKIGRVEDADISSEEFKKWVLAKWNIAPERNMKEYGHPAMFPEELVARVLKLFSFVGDVVLDPFNGAGTTTAVAKKLGRQYLGIDVSQEYCTTAQTRIEQILL